MIVRNIDKHYFDQMSHSTLRFYRMSKLSKWFLSETLLLSRLTSVLSNSNIYKPILNYGPDNPNQKAPKLHRGSHAQTNPKPKCDPFK